MSLFFSSSTEKRVEKLEWIMESNDGLAPELKLNFTNPYKGLLNNKSRKVPNIFEKFGKTLIGGMLLVMFIFVIKFLGFYN